MNAMTSAHTAAMAAFAPSGAVSKAEGRAFILQIEPDLAAFERVNVGVAIVQADGRRLVKVLTDFARLECLYGPNVRDLCELLTDLAKESFLAARDWTSPNLHVVDANEFFHVDPSAYLEQLFRQVVPAAKPRRDPRDSGEQRDGDKLRLEVTNIIRLQAPDLANEIIASTPFTHLHTRNGIRSVHIPLQPVGGAGALESADFSGQTAKLKLVTALLDIEAAAEVRSLKKTGLFIGRPKRSRTLSELAVIDSAIDYATSRAPASCKVEVSDDAQTLATSVIDWALAA